MLQRFLAVAVAALCCVQCSLLIDLPADCVPSDCDGFACNAEGTGCMATCANDGDCADGHLCDRETCSPRGCEADADPVSIGGAAMSSDLSAAWGDGRLGVAWVEDNTLKFQVFLGESLEPGAVRQLDPPSAVPAKPSVAWNGSGWAIAWEAETTDDEGRHEVLRFASVDTMGQEAIAPKNLWVTTVGTNGVVEKSIDDPNIAWHEAAQTYVLAWATRTTSSDIYMMFIRRDGADSQGRDDIPHGAALRVTQTEIPTITPLISPRADGVYDVVYRQGSASVDTILRTVNEEAAIEGSDVNLSSAASEVTHHGYARTTKGSVVGFTERDNSSGTTYRTQLRTNRTIAGDKRFEVDREFTDTNGGQAVSAVAGEYAIVAAAEREGRTDVYVARYLDNGARIGLPFSVTSDLDDVGAPYAAATPGGYVILAQTGATVTARHWTCDPVEE
jgi:hypothetical protein